MALIAEQTPGGGMVPCFVHLRCGNCRRSVRACYEVPEASPERLHRSLDEGSLRVWGEFKCGRCDYDKAYVLAFGRR